MSRARQVRRSVRWARYFNHYSHIPDVFMGGNAAAAAIWGGHWTRVRRQVKRRLAERAS